MGSPDSYFGGLSAANFETEAFEPNEKLLRLLTAIGMHLSNSVRKPRQIDITARYRILSAPKWRSGANLFSELAV